MGKAESLLLYLTIDFLAVLFMWTAEKKASAGSACWVRQRRRKPLSLHPSKIFLVISFLSLFSILALRDHVGADYIRYIRLYNSIGTDSLIPAEKEWMMSSPGYWIGCRILYLFTHSHYIMFAAVGYFTLKYLYKAIWENSTSRAFSLYLLICFCLYYYCFTGIRQMLALAIVACSYRHLKEGNLKKFLLCILAASLFHLSAIVFLAVWPVRSLKIDVKSLSLYAVAGLFLFFFFDTFLLLLSHTRYVQVYTDTEFARSYGLTTILNFFVRFVMFVFCVCFYKETMKRTPYAQPYFHAAGLCTVLQVCAIRFNVFGRITTYFYITYLFLLPEIFKTVEKHLTKNCRNFFKLFVMAFFALYHFVYYFSSAGAVGGNYLFYKFIGQ